MRYETVYMVWDIYNGVRTGIANLGNRPHYFSSVFDRQIVEYSESFELYPVNQEFMRRANRYWDIFRAWERRFHNGLADIESHPGHKGVDSEYDGLQLWINDHVRSLQALPNQYFADFRPLPGQDSLPPGVLRDLEVAWSISAPGNDRASA